MSDEQKMKIAKEYVDKQLETMKQRDAAPRNLSEHEYKALIREVAKNVKS
jgi:hypothetical protein